MPARNRRLRRTALPTRAVSTAVLLAMAGLAAAPPVAPATPLIAAFEHYVPGKGFDIGLVNATTGAALAVPPGVNSTSDEFHPALTPDGNMLVFTRTTLVAQPDGDVVPPAARATMLVDRQSGNFGVPFINTNLPGGGAGGAGATIVPPGARGTLAIGNRSQPTQPVTQTAVDAGPFFASPPGFVALSQLRTTAGNLGAAAASGTFLDVPHAAVFNFSNTVLRATTAFHFNEGNGSISEARTLLFKGTFTPSNQTFADVHTLNLSQNTPRHTTPRVPDGHLALDITTASGTDIANMQFPGDTAPSPLAAVNTSDPERMPAWSPDGVQLGFVRTTGTASATPIRNLLVFDSTVGLQTIVNPAVSLGAEAPSPQLRDFQATWGGLSLALTSSADSFSISCLAQCTAALAAGAVGIGPGFVLRPFVGTTGKKKTSPSVGIVIARRVGTRRLFGHTIPRIRAVGRVPLGIARSSKPRFRWTGRVNGRRLPPGNYLLTFRTLTRKGRILSTSRSIQFKLTRNGRVTGVRALKS